MNTDTQTIKTQELVLARLQEDFSTWVLVAPVAFAFAVVFLVLFYRQSETMSGLLKSLLIPPAVITVLGIAWAIWLLVYAVAGIWLGMIAEPGSATAVLRDQFVMLGLIPLIGYPVFLGVLATVVICIKHPTAFIPLVSVAIVSSIYLMFAMLFKKEFSWGVVMGPVLLVALVYVAMMYRQDAQTVNPVWASFLGLLRCSVYGLLAFLFLMPGCQSYDTKLTESKVLILFDISTSMLRADDLPPPGKEMTDEELKKMPKRLNKVIAKVVNSEILEKIQQMSPVSVYRFGARLDDYDVKQFKGGEKWKAEDWEDFLFPDLTKVEAPEKIKDRVLEKDERDKLQLKINNLYDGFTGATNVSGSALQALLRESGDNIQAIIIFSDGQSNLSSSDSMHELMNRATNPKKSTNIITVCVGDYIEPKSIRVEEIQAPIQARPDDKFPVQVPVYGDGMAGKNFDITLEAEQVIKDGDKWVPKPGGVRTTLSQKGKFKAEGKLSLDKIKFEIDVRKLKGIPSKDDTRDDEIMGYWQFTAKVPRDPDEHFAKGEHVSKPAQTLVQKKKMRVLIFSGGPSREYQFLRTLLFREMQENRIELSIYLQTGKEENVNQDVGKRLLSQFPTTLAKEGLVDDNAFYDLASYDVMIAIDPDWTELSNQQIQNVNDWVNKTWAGGFVFVAGPINTWQLAYGEKAIGKKLDLIKELLPVVVKDYRLGNLELDPTRPYEIKLKPIAESAKFDFMKLSDKNVSAQESWNEFFWEDEKDHKGKPINGFFNYYPVAELRKGFQLLATFDRPVGNPLVPDINLKEPPFIAAGTIGKGTTLYLGSPEFWRLRQVDEDFHKRFWIQACRFGGSGSQNTINEHGNILMVQKAPVGLVSLEANLMKVTKEPFSPDINPPFQVKVTMLEGAGKDKVDIKSFELKPRVDSLWTGWFQGEVLFTKPGRYRLSIAIPNTSKEVEHIITIYQPDPELDNPRPNPDHLYELATSAMPVLKIVDKKYHDAVETALRKNDKVAKEKKEQYQAEGKDDLRLCFDLENADLIYHCLTRVPPSEDSLKSGMSYLMDKGWESGWSLRTDQMIMALASAIGGLIFAILLLTRRWVFSIVVLALTGAVIGSVLLINVVGAPNWETFAINGSIVLFAIAGLLCVEWLTRKLLRLA